MWGEREREREREKDRDIDRKIKKDNEIYGQLNEKRLTRGRLTDREVDT